MFDSIFDHPGETSDLFEQLISVAEHFMSFIYEFSAIVLWYITTPIEDIISYYDPLNITGLAPSRLLFGWFEQFTPLELMLGVGIGVYLVWQFVTWVLNLVT